MYKPGPGDFTVGRVCGLYSFTVHTERAARVVLPRVDIPAWAWLGTHTFLVENDKTASAIVGLLNTHGMRGK